MVPELEEELDELLDDELVELEEEEEDTAGQDIEETSLLEAEVDDALELVELL